MAQPTPYDRQFNFQNQQALTPADPLPADELDSELNAVKLTLDQILTNLAFIQRDDGALLNESVARVTLNSDIDLGFGAPSVWAHNTNYKADFDTIFHESFFYKAATTHLSDPSPLGFANDLALGRWTLIADFSAAAVMGLGTMSTQNADLVVITGGTIDGVTISGVATPDADGKAAPKSYVDAQISALSATLSGKLSAASGDRLLFPQASAPVGWTKITTYDDYALRLVSGTGGGTAGTLAFSTVFGKTATDSTTITSATSAAHDHSGTTGGQNANHTHGFTASISTDTVAGGVGNDVGNTAQASNTAVAGSDHGHAIASSGSGGGHLHGMDIRVLRLDVILASKD